MTSIYLEMEKLHTLESGLGQVCLHLGQALARERDAEIHLGAYLPRQRAGCFGPAWTYRCERHWHRWLGVPQSCSAWHCLHQDSPYWPRNREIPVVLTVHDLNFLTQPGPEQARQRRLARLQQRLDRAAALTVISRATEADLRRYLRIPPIPLRVIYNGNCLAAEGPEERPAFAPEGPFLFSVAHIHPKKNAAVLLPMLVRRPGLALVLAGKDDHPYAGHLRREAERLGVADRVLLPGVIDEPAKRWLLRHCRAFVFPSLAEGFGLPVVEAMSLGKPVFLSRVASLPEVGGAEAFYWESFEPGAMLEVLERGLAAFAADPDRAERLRLQAGRFTWTETARACLQLYREVAAPPVSVA